MMILSGLALFTFTIACVATWILAPMMLQVIIEGGWIRNLSQWNNARRMRSDAQTARSGWLINKALKDAGKINPKGKTK
ncbi:MAG: hypothetical protein WA874_18095 [Chryseosolibacter sp.]